MATVREKRCKSTGCGNRFTPKYSFQTWCSPGCGYQISQDKLKKSQKKKKKEVLDRLKSKSDYAKDAQKAFNAFIRERDKGRGCISCGSMSAMAYHAGHYLTTKARPELRFNEYNCHLQCSHCNMYLSGNLIEYRKELVKRVGLDVVEWLEGPHELSRNGKEDLIEIRKKYQKKLSDMRKPKD